MEEYLFERISKETLKELGSLYYKAFGVRVHPDFIRKKFATERFGASYIGFLARCKKSNAVAAFYGVFPLIGDLDGERVLIAQSGDTMTDPNHQGKGLFTKLARLTYALAKQEGIVFVFGFPNKNSFPGFINKLNWEHYSDLHTYVIKSGALPFDKLFKKFNRFSYLYENYAKRKLKNWIVADLPENSLKANALGLGFVVHDVTFYSYKEYSTSFVLNVDGVKCNVKIDGRLWIGDLSICTESKFSETVSKLIEIARSISCSSIHFCAFKGSFLDHVLSKKHHSTISNPVGCLDLTTRKIGSKFCYQAIDFDTF